MSDGHAAEDGGAPGAVPLPEVWKALVADSGIGVVVFERSGRVRYVNEEAASAYFNRPAAEVDGRMLEELHGRALADEFERTLATLEREGAILFREVWGGRQLLGTARLVRGEAADHVLMFTRHVTGEPPRGPSMPVVYSDFVQLGELAVLSPRELEVLSLVGQGLTTKEIARILHRSPRTVDVHRRSIGLKLGETGAVALAQLAAEAGLVVSDSQRTRLASFGEPPEPDARGATHT